MPPTAAPAGWRTLLPRQSPAYVALVHALVLVWGLGDVLSTSFASVALGTAGFEANPWIGFLLSTEPLLVAVLTRAVVLSAGVVLLVCRPVVERVPGWRLWLGGLVVVGALVVLNNLAAGLRAFV